MEKTQLQKSHATVPLSLFFQIRIDQFNGLMAFCVGTLGFQDNFKCSKQYALYFIVNLLRNVKESVLNVVCLFKR